MSAIWTPPCLKAGRGFHMSERKITLVTSPSEGREWGCGSRPGDLVIAVSDIDSITEMIEKHNDSDGYRIERIILDGIGSPADFLQFLAKVPAEILADVLYVENESRSFLSAAGAEGRRVLYSLAADDLDFYCAVHDLRGSETSNVVSACEAAGKASRVKVLIADDDQKTRVLLVGLVEGLGCEAIVARTGLEAVRATVENRPQVLFLDGLMPEMHGLEVARVIRQLDPSYTPRIVMLTAFDATRYRNEAKLKYGVDGYLSKPVNRENFASAIFDDDGSWRLGRHAPLAVAL